MSNETNVTSLSSTSLQGMNPAVTVPTYDRSRLRPAIVHIGVGGFHRAHLATYVDDLCSAGSTDWAIVGAGVMPGDQRMAEALEPQDYLYCLITRGPDSTSVEVVGSIIDYIHAAPDAQPLVDQIAEATTQLVSLTVTEGGYPVDDVTGEFVPTSPNAGPGGAFALIAAGLEKRRTAGGGPVTIMSCDNIMGNGGVTRTATIGEAAKLSDELVSWIDASVTFPNSMVDRITPATAPADGAWLAEEYGIDDRWPVVAEPFRQWVVEDNFAGDRLPLEQLDVIVTDNIEPYEFMKLRLLNAGHSTLAYLAALDGITTVDAAMNDAAIRRFVESFLRVESQPVLPPVAGIDIDAYIDSLIVRFSNPQIGDQIARLCLDGSAKFPKFLMPTIRAQLEADGPIALSALALAGWCDYLNGRDHHDAEITVSADPNLDEAVEFARGSRDDPASFLSFDTVFGADIAASDRFREAFTGSLSLLRAGGIESAIDAAIREDGVQVSPEAE